MHGCRDELKESDDTESYGDEDFLADFNEFELNDNKRKTNYERLTKVRSIDEEQEASGIRHSSIISHPVRSVTFASLQTTKYHHQLCIVPSTEGAPRVHQATQLTSHKPSPHRPKHNKVHKEEISL